MTISEPARNVMGASVEERDLVGLHVDEVARFQDGFDRLALEFSRLVGLRIQEFRRDCIFVAVSFYGDDEQHGCVYRKPYRSR
jgi:hypothetical protein